MELAELTERPWVDSPAVPALQKSQSILVEFPEEDESMGAFHVTYFGPDANVSTMHRT